MVYNEYIMIEKSQESKIFWNIFILFREKRKMKKVTFNKLTRNYSVRFKEKNGSIFVGGKTTLLTFYPDPSLIFYPH